MNSNQALVMEEMAFFALLLLCLLIQACNSNHLILIDSSEILSAPRASSWDFVIQNPFKGVIEVAPSPVDQFQLLINVSSTHQSPEGVGYRLRHTDDSIYVELFSRAASTSLSSSSGDEERIYLQLLFITVASLVLVSFVVSIIFSCWWLRSQRCEDADQMTNADISDSAQADVDTCDEPELVELLPSGAGSPQKAVGSNQPTAQLYISPTAAYATISMASDPSLLLGGASADGPISYPVPRYVVSGGLGASLPPAQSIFNEHTVLGAPIIIPAEAASFLQSTVDGRHPSPPLAYLSLGGILNPISNPSSVGLGASSSSGIGSIRGVCPTTVHSSSHTCTLPAKRHVAMEFLDENVVATMTRPRSRCRQTILPEAMHAVTRTVQSASASTAVLPLHPQVLLIPGDNSTDSVAKHPLGPAVATALIPRGSATSEVPIYVGHNPAVGLIELLPRASSSSIPTSSCSASGPLQPTDGTAGLLSDTRKGANVTVLTDPSFPTALLFPTPSNEHRPAVRSAAIAAAAPDTVTISTHTTSTIGFTSPKLAAYVALPVASQSSVDSILTSDNSLAHSTNSPVVSLSMITGMSDSATYVASSLLAEMASCPQHSYLFRQTPTDVFKGPSRSVAGVEVSSVSEAPTSRASRTSGPSRHSNQLDAPSSANLDGSGTNSIPPSSSTDEFSLGSGTGIPDVPSLFKDCFPPIRSSSKSPDAVSRNDDDSSVRFSRSRFGPNPPKRSVSLGPKPNAETTDTECSTVPLRPSHVDSMTKDASENDDVPTDSTGDFKSATLGRMPMNGSLGAEDDPSSGFAPGSSATLPSGGTNPRSALKSADRSGPKVSKHLRFTTLTLITFLWLLVVIVLGSPDVVPSANYAHSGASQVLRWNVIKPSPLASKPKSQVADDALEVQLTVWIPQDMIAKIKSGRASLEGEKKDLPKGGLTAPASIQLWLNASSRTEIRLASQIDRAIVHIYDAVNAHQNLGARICRQRYACEHSCDPGARHDCICQRGYRPAGPKDRERLLAQGNRLANVDLENIKGRICLDLDECAHPEIRDRCSRMGGVCTNRPGDYACLCPSGQPCLECDATCPVGFWAQGDCSHNRSIECKPCSGPCPTGMYETKPCGPRSDRMCQACRPLCISEEFEFAPCKASSNRICKRKNLIPELIVPYKKNVWFENLLQVKDVVFTLAPDDLSRLPLNKSVVLDRSSGYQIRLDFDSLNLLPVLGPVDHSNGNDNALFLASARALDRSITEPDTYRWSSSSSGHYQAVHAYVIKANNTLSRLCPYPVPPLYRLGVRVHRNVTTATVAVTDLPGHRPVLAACRTYRTHGYFPPVEDTSALLGKLSTTFVTEDDRVYGHARPAEPFTNQDITAPVVACLEPSKLPAIFGPHWNSQLASSRSIYYEGKRLCGQLKSDCQNCLAACAEELKSNSLTCKPTANPADNGRSPRLEICFDCCARDNCSDVCDKYSAHRCHLQLCSHGLRLDFPLTPEWPKQGEFLCHMQPAPTRPIYRLHWSLLYQGRPLTPDRFPAALMLPVSDTASKETADQFSPDPQSGTDGWSFGHGGQITQVYRGLLNVHYTSGLDHLPDMIGGTDTMQSAYFWSKQTVPLVSGSGMNTAFDPISSAASSAATTGALYANAMRPTSSNEHSSVQVWPSRPLGVNTAAWGRLSGAPCAAADPLLEQLNLYTPALPPYVAMGEAKVEYVGNYLYSVSHTKGKSKLTFSIPRSASLLGAVFSPASVDRGHYLRASLALAWLPEDGASAEVVTPTTQHTTWAQPAERKRFWVIDLTGQVDQFPGLFRLRIFPEYTAEKTVSSYASRTAEDRSNLVSEATVEVEGEEIDTDAQVETLPDEEQDEDPLVDYDVGVFEERKFQLRLLIPGPDEEPDYEKVFRIVITDAKNRLTIHVKRTIQPPDEMALRRSYGLLFGNDLDDARPALVDLLPSLAARQQSLRQHSADDELQSIPPDPASTDASEVRQFGPPASVVYALLITLLMLLLCLFIGQLTQPDPTDAWVELQPFPQPTTTTSTSSADDQPTDRVALICNPAHHNTRLSSWCRVLLFVVYLCVKSAYTFGVTLTALVIVARYVTREPAAQLATLPEWNADEQSNGFTSTSLTRQKLLQDSMDVHLRNELVRQQTEVRRMRDACDRGLDRLFDQMEERLTAASKLAASRRSRVLLSQAVAELARVTAVASTLQLTEGLAAFNQTAEWALQRLKSDLLETERALGNSDWLTGARIIYAEVVRLRGLTPDPSDPTRSFLHWAKLLGPENPTMEDLVSETHLPQLTQPSLMSLLQPDQFSIPLPPMRPAAGGSPDDSDDEPEYGPPYVPFLPDPLEVESNEMSWSNYGPDSDPDTRDLDQLLKEELSFPHLSLDSNSASSVKDNETAPLDGGESLFGQLQIGWVHVLGATLLLDALWLIHRVLHTVDTAERILYGEILLIDLTAEGLRRRSNRRTHLRDGCKRVFEALMQPGTVRKVCASVLALLIVTQASAHLDRLLSQDTLDYIGYYDNLILPVHLHARLVNSHVTRSAQRLNQYEVAGLEAEMGRRMRDSQHLLHEWTSWLTEIEQEQCHLLLTYKAAAQQVRTQMAAKISRNPALNKLHLPVHVIHNGQDVQPISAFVQRTDSQHGRDGATSQATDAPVPRHCRMTRSEREAELADARRLDVPHCPLDAIVPRLFKDYNVSEYFEEVVQQSEAWLLATREYLSRALYCLFVYVGALVLWNTAGTVLWFYLGRLKLLPRKVLFESDVSSWSLPQSRPQAQ